MSTHRPSLIRIPLRLTLWSLCIIVACAGGAAAQSPIRGRVVRGPAVVWRPGFASPATVAQVGDLLEIVSRQGNWYEVIVPATGQDVRVRGFIAVSQLELIGTARPPARTASPAGAPASPPAAGSRAPAVKSKPGLRAYGIFERERMAASQSFEAVLDTSSVRLAGFGAEGTNLWKHVFARFALTHGSEVGTRVLVDSSQKVFPLNIPLTIEMTPVEIAGGWRFESRKPHPVVVPFAGAGLLIQHYKETSQFAGPSDDTDTSDTGSVIFGGVEIALGFVRVGAEAQYRSLPNTIGAAGVSQAFNENNLGGGVLRVTFGVGF